tara:strand:+ start:3021 stop:3260 length:240 start_codon:yes stop_codon:yes gene_type:complete
MDFKDDKMEALEKKMQILISKMENLEKTCDKMSNHIDFIDNVYNRVKMPLYWICDKVNSLTYKDVREDSDKLTNIEEND